MLTATLPYLIETPTMGKAHPLAHRFRKMAKVRLLDSLTGASFADECDAVDMICDRMTEENWRGETETVAACILVIEELFSRNGWTLPERYLRMIDQRCESHARCLAMDKADQDAIRDTERSLMGML